MAALGGTPLLFPMPCAACAHRDGHSVFTRFPSATSHLGLHLTTQAAHRRVAGAKNEQQHSVPTEACPLSRRCWVCERAAFPSSPLTQWSRGLGRGSMPEVFSKGIASASSLSCLHSVPGWEKDCLAHAAWEEWRPGGSPVQPAPLPSTT